MRIESSSVAAVIAENGVIDGVQYDAVYRFSDGTVKATRVGEYPGPGIESAELLWLKPAPI